MPGEFRLNMPWLAKVYGGGLPALDQFLCLSGALPMVRMEEVDITYWTDPDGEFSPNDEDYTRAEGSTFKHASTEATAVTASLVEHALESRMDTRTRKRSNYPRLREAGRRNVWMKILGNLEKDMAAFFADTSNFGANTAATALSGQWDSDSSNPLDDIATQIRAIRTATGGADGMFHLAVTEAQRDALVQHARIRDSLKYTGAGVVSDAELGRYFASVGIGRIHVKKSVKNSANKAESFSGARFFSDNAEVWLAQEQSTEINDGSWAKVFYLDDTPDQIGVAPPFAGLPLIRMEMGFREEVRSDVDRAVGDWLVRLTNASAARVITDCLS